MVEEYEVGYGKPPRLKQFAKGHSGNPKGRPKGSINLQTIADKILREPIRLTENGQVKTVSKLEAVTRQVISKALTGDIRAVKELYKLAETMDRLDEIAAPEPNDNRKDKTVLNNLLDRIRSQSISSGVTQTGVSNESNSN